MPDFRGPDGQWHCGNSRRLEIVKGGLHFNAIEKVGHGVPESSLYAFQRIHSVWWQQYDVSVLVTVVPLRVPWVRIPPYPPITSITIC